MRLRTALIGTGGAAALAAALFVPQTASAAPAQPAWAPVDQATIHPGVQTSVNGEQCTANFIFYDATDVYIGQAAHCTGGGAPTDTNGCDVTSKPLGTEVKITGAAKPGVLAYSSWITMKEQGEQDKNACEYNDFALVRIDPEDRGKVNPTMPKFGGPTGIDTDGASRGEELLSYQDSELRLGIDLLRPKQGISLGNAGAYGLDALTVTPGIPGDSGSGIMSGDGKAMGILSTVALFPIPLSNGISRLAPALDYENAHGPLKDLTLAEGTEPFHGPAIPILGLFF